MTIDRFDVVSYQPAGSAWMLEVLLGAAVIALYLLFRVPRVARQLRRSRALRERFSQLAPSPPEPGLVQLAGTVETDEPGDAAIRIQAPVGAWYQDLENPRGWHRSNETRPMVVHPFTLVLAGSQERLRVLPDERLELLAWPEPPAAAADAGERLYELVLASGSRVLVDGILVAPSVATAGYRGVVDGFVLRAPRDGLLTIEVEGFAARQERFKVVVGRIGDALAAALALAYFVALGLYARDRQHQVSVIAEVTVTGTCANAPKSPATILEQLHAAAFMMGPAPVTWCQT